MCDIEIDFKIEVHLSIFPKVSQLKSPTLVARKMV